MAGIISRCSICGEFFDSRKHLRKHIDRYHRITNSKFAAADFEKKRKKEKTLVVVPLNGIPLVLEDWVGIPIGI